MNKIIVTTENINDRKYDVIDVIFSYGSSDEKLFKTANPLEAYPKVREQLREEAIKLGADAVIGTHFDYRIASKQGCGGTNQSFEVFAYGTAIKFK